MVTSTEKIYINTLPMNTKYVMTTSSVILGLAGIMLIFGPDFALKELGVVANPVSLILAQVIGGMYLGFSILNWMLKKSLLGGIYNRPIAFANFTHFFIVGSSLMKTLMLHQHLPKTIYLAAFLYLLFSLLFLLVLFRSPVNLESKE